MKLSFKTLTILTVLAFLLSPLITIVPGILLLFGIAFMWISEISKGISKSLETTAEIIEEENDTNIKDLGDKIVIHEKKTIYKKDLTFADFQKYGLKNTSCINICGAFEAAKTKDHYKLDHRHCMICKKWLVTDEINCPCCSSELRTKEKIKKEMDTLF